MDAVKPVTPYVAAQYIDKEEETWLKEKESQRAWATVKAQEKKAVSGGKPLAVPVAVTQEKNCPWWNLVCHLRKLFGVGKQPPPTATPTSTPAPTSTPTLAPMTQTPTQTLIPELATHFAYATANTPIPTRTPLPTSTPLTYLDAQLQAYGIDTRMVDNNLLPVILKATQLTANKFQPLTGGTPQQAFIMSHGTIAIIINENAQIDKGNCETVRVVPGTQYWPYGQKEPTYNVGATITCKNPPSLANWIHEFVHAFDLNYRVFGSPNLANLFSDNLKDLIVGDQYIRTINVGGDVIRDPRGFVARRNSWESWMPSSTEEFADTQTNAILDGSGVDIMHGFTNDAYGNARRDEWNALMNQWQQDMQAHFEAFMK